MEINTHTPLPSCGWPKLVEHRSAQAELSWKWMFASNVLDGKGDCGEIKVPLFATQIFLTTIPTPHSALNNMASITNSIESIFSGSAHVIEGLAESVLAVLRHLFDIVVGLLRGVVHVSEEVVADAWAIIEGTVRGIFCEYQRWLMYTYFMAKRAILKQKSCSRNTNGSQFSQPLRSEYCPYHSAAGRRPCWSHRRPPYSR